MITAVELSNETYIFLPSLPSFGLYTPANIGHPPPFRAARSCPVCQWPKEPLRGTPVQLGWDLLAAAALAAEHGVDAETALRAAALRHRDAVRAAEAS